MLFGGWLMIRRLGGLHRGQFRKRMRHYPPTWAAGVAAFCVYVFIEWPMPRPVTLWWGLFWASTCAALITLAHWPKARTWTAGFLLRCHQRITKRFRRKKSVPQEDDQRTETRPVADARKPKGIPTDLEEFEKWLRTESPIEKPEDDQFDMLPMARRLARKVRNPHAFVAVALTGPYGSGKSSVLKLVKYYLKNPPPARSEALEEDEALFPPANIIVCRADTWGTDASSAPRLILDAAIKELRRHVDCTALACMPLNYLHAMQASPSGLLGVFAALLGSDVNPREVLKRMNQVVTTAGLRLLIFIEDADRDAPDEKRKHAINALLDGLHDVENISFIFTVGSDHIDAPLIRLCEHTEPMPLLDRAVARKLVCEFIHKQLAKSGAILPNSPSLLRHESDRPNEVSIVGRSKPPIEALTTLLRTPRYLKTVLRHTMDIWEDLPGEVFFEDILCVRALQIVEPEAYVFLCKHIDSAREEEPPAARGPERNGIGGTRPPSSGQVERSAEWKSLESREKLVNPESAKALLEYVLPVLFIDEESTAQYQRISTPPPTDYWARLHAGEVDGLRDQVVLRGLERWRIDPLETVHEGKTFAQNIVSNDGFCARASYFQDHIIFQLDTVDEAIHLASDIGTPHVSPDRRAFAYDVVRSVAWKTKSGIDEFAKWAQKQIQISLLDPKGDGPPLDFAYQTVGSLLKTMRGSAKLVCGWLLRAVYNATWNDPSEILETLGATEPGSLAKFVRRTAELAGKTERDADWQQFGNIILAAWGANQQALTLEVTVMLAKRTDVMGVDDSSRATAEKACIPSNQGAGEESDSNPTFTFDIPLGRLLFDDQLPFVAEKIVNIDIETVPNIGDLYERKKAVQLSAQNYLASDDPAVVAWRERQSADPPQDERGNSGDDAEG
jgi:KAP-like P-loop domain-containing protein